MIPAHSRSGPPPPAHCPVQMPRVARIPHPRAPLSFLRHPCRKSAVKVSAPRLPAVPSVSSGKPGPFTAQQAARAASMVHAYLNAGDVEAARRYAQQAGEAAPADARDALEGGEWKGWRSTTSKWLPRRKRNAEGRQLMDEVVFPLSANGSESVYVCCAHSFLGWFRRGLQAVEWRRKEKNFGFEKVETEQRYVQPPLRVPRRLKATRIIPPKP